MPKTGIPVSKSSASRLGAPGAYTLAGPPLRMIAAGDFATISATDMVCGTISEYTCASRTRRAISCAYWAPKSTTRTVSRVTGRAYPPDAGGPPGRTDGRLGGVPAGQVE